MGMIHPSVLESTVSIGIEIENQRTKNIEWMGSGFLYGYVKHVEKDGTRNGEVYLVTNKHVLENNKQILIQFNDKKSSNSKNLTLDLIGKDEERLYFGHPDKDIDISVIPLLDYNELKHQYNVPVIDSKLNVYTIKEMEELGVMEGDYIYVTGFPMGMVDINKKRAIVRTGCIARINDVYEDNSPEILLDCVVFPGNSGGPVTLRTELDVIKGTKSAEEPRVIGIVKEYITHQETARSTITGEIRSISSENSGLSIVHPIDFINQTITAYNKKFSTNNDD